jgi:hypothetical protein
MRIRYPEYYKTFRCIASDCPDSCCKEWEVLVDETSAARYLEMEGPLGDDLRRYLYEDEEGDWYLRITDGRCPMWRQDGLCRIQAEHGHEALCQTCREFPRLKHEYGDFVELGLELSCPEAARIIFSEPAQWVEEQVPGGEEPEYDPADMEVLLRTRQKMLQILADTRYSVAESLALGLLYGYRAQDALDGAEMDAFEPAEELAFGDSVAAETDPAALAVFQESSSRARSPGKPRLMRESQSGTVWSKSRGTDAAPHRVSSLRRFFPKTRTAFSLTVSCQGVTVVASTSRPQEYRPTNQSFSLTSIRV